MLGCNYTTCLFFLYMFYAYCIKIILTMLPKELDSPKTKPHNLYSPILFYLTLKPHNLYTLKPPK